MIMYFLIFIWLLGGYIAGSFMCGTTHGTTTLDLPKFFLVGLLWPIYLIYLIFIMIFG
jgi:hypothetical protein